MNVKEFYQSGNYIFTPEVLQEFDFIINPEIESEVLNYLYKENYNNTILSEEDPTAIANDVKLTLLTYKDYFKSIKDTLDFTFNPNEASKTEDLVKITSEETNVKTGAETDNSSSNETSSDIKSGGDTDTITITDNTINTRNGKETTDSTPGVTTYNKTSKSSYNSNNLQLTDELEVSNTGTDTVEKTYTGLTDDSNKTYNETKSKVFNNETTQYEKDSSQTNTKEYNNVTDNFTKNYNEERQSKSTNLTLELIETIYKSKTINLYNEIVVKVSEGISIPVYIFE